ncbi:MAG: S8 family peptidase [Anaerovoracaceae bacterium]
MTRANKNILIVSIIAIVLIVLLGSLFYLGESNKTDSDFYLQWGLKNNENQVDINAEQMWKEYKGDKEIVVAVIDTGVDFESAELSGLEWNNPREKKNGKDDDHNGYVDDIHGWNFIDNNNEISTEKEYEESHGTAVVGIIAAKKNGKGIQGVAYPAPIKIMSLKVLSFGDTEKDGKVEDVIRAIKYAEQMGADICNLSFSTEKEDPNFQNAILNSKMLFVASAGNVANFGLHNINNNKIYPATYRTDNLISVASINKERQISRKSNYGNKVIDIAAPGENIYAISADNSYSFQTGTSFAAPHVTGVAALIYSSLELATAKEVKEILIKSVCRKEEIRKKVIAEGYLDGYKALKITNEIKKQEEWR